MHNTAAAKEKLAIRAEQRRTNQNETPKWGSIVRLDLVVIEQLHGPDWPYVMVLSEAQAEQDAVVVSCRDSVDEPDLLRIYFRDGVVYDGLPAELVEVIRA